MTALLVDGRWVRPGMTGVGVTAAGLIGALGRSGARVGVISAPGATLPPLGPACEIISARADLVSHPRTEAFEQLGIPALCLRKGYRAFLSFEQRVPLFHPGFATYSYIHDLSILKLNASHTRKYSAYLKATIALTVASATRIITVSEVVREDIMRLLRVPANRILVVPNADSGLSAHAPELLPGLASPFLFAVGMNNPRKNLSVLLAGFKAFASRRTGVRLAITGNRDMIAKAVAEAGVAGVINLGFVGPGALRHLYASAEALVYPSLEEGFGIPLVDAWSWGCPVICSDIPVFREVIGEHARYFDPRSADSLAQALFSHGGRAETARMPPPPKDYSWDSSARILMDDVRLTTGA